MKGFLGAIVLALIIIPHAGVAQYGTLNGRITDAKTLKGLPFASIYINNTTIGTTSFEDGEYFLRKIPPGTHELIISYIGYQTYRTKVSIGANENITISIKLTRSATNLANVNINAKKDAKWKAQFEKFKKLFFGADSFTKSCTIYNPWVLEFTEGTNGVIIASASAPLDIENLAIGYRINYQLTNFSAGPSAYRISGYAQFKEIETRDSLLSNLWSTRRAQIYFGSSRHFFKSIIQNQATENSFLALQDISGLPDIVRKSSYLTNINQSILPYDLLNKITTRPSENQFRIVMPDRLEVHYLKKSVPPSIYRNVTNPISWIEVKSGFLDVSSEGILLNPGAAVLSGAMGDARMAQALPNDYVPPTPKISEDIEVAKRKKNLEAAFLERPYLQTDRSYYYPGDIIFFKAYMNYITPMIKDSLSHVLYVELINENEKVIEKKILSIEDGISQGNFNVPATLDNGSYAIRAYTRWMLNFKLAGIFVKPIAILKPTEVVANNSFEIPEEVQVRIIAEKETFTLREKITLAIEARDEFGFPIASNLSISVTDVNQVAPTQDEVTILTDFNFPDSVLQDTIKNDIVYEIQYGIEFSGSIKPAKRLQPGVVTVFQKDSPDVFALPTDPHGVFKQHLQISTPTEFYLEGKNYRNKRVEVKMNSIVDPVVKKTFQRQLIEIVKSVDPAFRHVPSSLLRTSVLDEVVVEEKRIEKSTTSSYHNKADFSIDGDWLRQTNTNDLLSAIQARVPGLRILYQVNNGTITKFLTIGGPSSLESATECLVTVDGIVLVPAEGQSVADQLAYMNVSEIESIDVLKYGSGAIYGARGANGVIIVVTKKGDYSTKKRARPDFRKLKQVKLAGYSESLKFESPDYSIINDEGQPDTRSTIYWNPDLYTDGKVATTISFYSADIPTSYRIVVEGITSKGRPIRGERIIEINR